MSETAEPRPRVHLDQPKPALIAHPIEHLWGWMAVADRSQAVTARAQAASAGIRKRMVSPSLINLAHENPLIA